MSIIFTYYNVNNHAVIITFNVNNYAKTYTEINLPTKK